MIEDISLLSLFAIIAINFCMQALRYQQLCFFPPAVLWSSGRRICTQESTEASQIKKISQYNWSSET